MSVDGILLTHAEVATAVAGFAGVIAVLRRPLTSLQQQRFWTMLLGALVQILACLVPVWMMGMDLPEPVVWQYASIVYVTMNAVITTLLYVLILMLGLRGIVIVNHAVTIVVYALTAAMWVPLLVNLFLVTTAGFGLYYLALMAGLVAIFVTFADVVVGRDPG